MSPGLWLQRITTVEPTDDQLEIALLALDRALAREEGRPRAADGVIEGSNGWADSSAAAENRTSREPGVTFTEPRCVEGHSRPGPTGPRGSSRSPRRKEVVG